MDLQIDDFYRDAVCALLQLYQVFPRRHALYVEDLIGLEEPDQYGLPSSRHQACLGAMLWLAEEGYLRYDSTIGHQALDQAVLSEKGFLRLTRSHPGLLEHSTALSPSLQQQHATLAWQLREALQQRNSLRLGQLARVLLCSDTV